MHTCSVRLLAIFHRLGLVTLLIRFGHSSQNAVDLYYYLSICNICLSNKTYSRSQLEKLVINQQAENFESSFLFIYLFSYLFICSFVCFRTWRVNLKQFPSARMVKTLEKLMN